METIMAVSEYLKEVTIMEGDFQNACEDADKGDFVFIDSPYAPLNPTSFEAYTKEGFDVESHRRLAAVPDQIPELHTARGLWLLGWPITALLRITEESVEQFSPLFRIFCNSSAFRLRCH